MAVNAGDTIVETRDHTLQHHPDVESVSKGFKCEYCNRVWQSVVSRARHYKGCKHKPSTTDLQPVASLPPQKTTPIVEETILHLVSCEALVGSRSRHKTDYYRETYGLFYYYSLKFLRWVHDLFNGPLGRTEDVEEPAAEMNKLQDTCKESITRDKGGRKGLSDFWTSC